MSCSQDNPITEIEEEVINLAPNDFDIEIIDISHESATINWNEATDPENDSVSYNIYLNQTLVAEGISELTYQFSDLSELTNYIGKVIANDANNNETSKTFSFTTEKYYLKYLKTYDFGEINFGIGYAAGSSYSMMKTNDENYIIAGKSQRPDGNAFRFFILKIDYNGNEIWKKFYDYQLYDSWNFKIIESATGFVLVGHHHVLNLDNDGNAIWHKKIDSYDIADGSAEIKSVALDLQGNIYLAGGRGSSDPEVPQEAVLTKLNNSGEIIWEKVFKSSFRSFFNDIIINSSDQLIILGSVETSGTTMEEYIQGPSSVEQIDFWVLKTNTDGEIIWQNTFGDGGYDFPSKIIFKSNGNYVFAGYSWGAYDISQGRIFEISPEGNEEWNVFTGLTSTFSIAETLDNGFIATGRIDIDSYNTNVGLYKFDNYGNEEWNQKYSEYATYLNGSGVIVENDGGFRISGSRNKYYFNDNDKPMIIIYKTDPSGDYE
tara:strand:- start:74 stop:1540 length:1467 start_codon:yes stop_codon:yes gene_type:complete